MSLWLAAGEPNEGEQRISITQDAEVLAAAPSISPRDRRRYS